MDERVVCGVRREHSRERYADRLLHLLDCGIPVPRMRQLPTNPILDRSGTPVLTGVYQQDSSSMRPQAHALPFPLDTSPVISTLKLSGKRVK